MRFIRIGLLLLVTGILIAGLSFLFTQRDFVRSGNIPENASSSSIRRLTEPTGSDRVVQVVSVPEEFSNIVPSDMQLTLPENLEISIFAAGLGKPRFFDFDDAGNLYVTDIGGGRVVFVSDSDSDGVAEQIITVVSGLRSPHGIDVVGKDLYVGEEHQVILLKDLTGDGRYSAKEVIVPGLPTNGSHVSRTVQVGPDGKLYVSIGSSCNVCEEDDPRRAAIVRYNLDGSGEEIYATGLRNAVGFVFSGDRIWATENGRDRLGDDLPPEEINIVEQGKHYGWPYCYAEGRVSPEYPDRAEFCQTTTHPLYQMQAHTAPLGLSFYTPKNNEQLFPKNFSDHLFVAFHGSWNRTVPVGYHIGRIDPAMSRGQPLDFITGWLQPDGTSWGRPVGVGFDQKGAMFISDDKAGLLYRVTTKSNP